MTEEFIPLWQDYLGYGKPDMVYQEDLLDDGPWEDVIHVPTLNFIEEHLGNASYGLANDDLARNGAFPADGGELEIFLAGMPEHLASPYILYYPVGWLRGRSPFPEGFPACIYMDRDPKDGLKVETIIEPLHPFDLPRGHLFWDAETTWVALMNPDKSGTFVFTSTREAQDTLLDETSSQEVYAVRQDQVFSV